MKTWLRRTAWALLLVALVIAAFRLALIAQPMETGWETIATTSRDAAFGWTGWKHTPISNREPSEQAEFWLREVDRILSSHPESAELCMGAAWVLDTPGVGFLSRYFKKAPRGGTEGLNTDALDSACSLFEADCHKRCLALAERATELDPDDVRWWRMRALLQFVEYPMTTLSGRPRETAWREVLDQCSQHDPNNALYDYLAARTLWNDSAEVDWVSREDGELVAQIKVMDEAAFEEGSRRFEAGQKKPFLAIGEAGYPAITEFLSWSRLSKIDQAEVAVHRVVTFRPSGLLSHTLRWLGNLADEAEQRGAPSDQIAKFRQKLRLFEQAIAPEETSAMKCNMVWGRPLLYAVTESQELAERHPDLIEKDEIDQFVAKAQANLTEAYVLEKAVNELEEPRLAQQDAAVFSVVIAVNTATLAALSLILACVSFLVAALMDRRSSDTTRLGFSRHAIAWAVGLGLSILLFGLMPAEIIGPNVQTLLATIFAWGFVLTTIGFIVWKAVLFGKQRRFQYRILTLLGCMTAVAVFAWIWPVLEGTASWLLGLPSQFSVSAKGWSGIDAATLQGSPQLGTNKWRWALLQWNAYAGPYLALAFSLILVALWSLKRQAKFAGEPALRHWARLERSRWSALFRCLATSALTAGLCALLIYLCLIPSALRVAESQFQYRMRYCRNPADQIARIHAARAKVLASEEDMKAIREEVEHHFARAQEESARRRQDAQ